VELSLSHEGENVEYFVCEQDAERSRDSSVGVATGYELDDQGVRIRVPVRSKIFSSPRRPDRLWAPPASYKMSTGCSLPRSEADRSAPTKADVKKTWIYTSTPRHAFMA
jgi:hypothetical protein